MKRPRSEAEKRDERMVAKAVLDLAFGEPEPLPVSFHAKLREIK